MFKSGLKIEDSLKGIQKIRNEERPAPENFGIDFKMPYRKIGPALCEREFESEFLWTKSLYPMLDPMDLKAVS